MNREEILLKSRQENNGADAWEAEAMAQAGRIAGHVGMLLCSLAALLEAVITGNVSMDSWMIYFGILTATFTVKYVKMRRKHELALTILYGGMFVLFLALFIRDLMR